MTPRNRNLQQLGSLIAALGPLAEHVQVLTASPAGFMARLSTDTPRPALEAILTEFDRHAAQLRTQGRKPKRAPAPKASKPRQTERSA